MQSQNTVSSGDVEAIYALWPLHSDNISKPHTLGQNLSLWLTHACIHWLLPWARQAATLIQASGAAGKGARTGNGE